MRTVLAKGGKKIKGRDRDRLRKCIKENEKDFSSLLSNKKVNKKTLAKIGGNPLALILSVGIPILLDLLRGK